MIQLSQVFRKAENIAETPIRVHYIVHAPPIYGDWWAGYVLDCNAFLLLVQLRGAMKLGQANILRKLCQEFCWGGTIV